MQTFLMFNGVNIHNICLIFMCADNNGELDLNAE